MPLVHTTSFKYFFFKVFKEYKCSVEVVRTHLFLQLKKKNPTAGIRISNRRRATYYTLSSSSSSFPPTLFKKNNLPVRRPKGFAKYFNTQTPPPPPPPPREQTGRPGWPHAGPLFCASLRLQTSFVCWKRQYGGPFLRQALCGGPVGRAWG